MFNNCLSIRTLIRLTSLIFRPSDAQTIKLSYHLVIRPFNDQNFQSKINAMELAGATILFSPDNVPLYYRAFNFLIRAFHLRQLGFRRYYEAEVPLNGLPKKGWIIWHPLHSNDKSSTEEYTTYAPSNVFRRCLKATNSLPLQKSLS